MGIKGRYKVRRALNTVGLCILDFLYPMPTNNLLLLIEALTEDQIRGKFLIRSPPGPPWWRSG